MIQHLLVAGAKISWRKPPTLGSPNDGAIQPSTNPANAMIFLGSTRDQPRGLFSRLFRPAPSGYRVPENTPVPHTWLDYISGRTAFLAQGSDVLTGFMSGCLIARGTYNGAMSVFHMGTTQDQEVTRLVKTGFRTDLPGDTTGFYPAAAWSDNERVGTGQYTEVIALVTSSGSFFSILLCRPMHLYNEWTVGGIKQVPPLNRTRIMAKLM